MKEEEEIAWLASLTAEKRERLKAVMTPVELDKGETLVREGSVDDRLYFLTEGIVRAFRSGDEESTLWFATKGEIVLSSWGYMCGEASKISIVAECDCTLYRIEKEDVERLSGEDAETANFFRHHIEKLYMEVEEWMLNMMEPSAEKRYLYIVREKPELIATVKLKDIASYIYLRPQSLSRIRSRIAKKRGSEEK